MNYSEKLKKIDENIASYSKLSLEQKITIPNLIYAKRIYDTYIDYKTLCPIHGVYLEPKNTPPSFEAFLIHIVDIFKTDCIFDYTFILYFYEDFEYQNWDVECPIGRHSMPKHERIIPSFITEIMKPELKKLGDAN